MKIKRKNKIIGLFVSLVLLIIIMDQASKFFIRKNWELFESRPVIEGIFHLTRVHNTGAAFGILKGHTGLFLILGIILLLLVYKYFEKLIADDVVKTIIFACIVGGAIGNFIDRFAFGYVVDFLDFRIWPVFNVADTAITIAVIAYIAHLFFTRKKVNDDS